MRRPDACCGGIRNRLIAALSPSARPLFSDTVINIKTLRIDAVRIPRIIMIVVSDALAFHPVREPKTESVNAMPDLAAT